MLSNSVSSNSVSKPVSNRPGVLDAAPAKPDDPVQLAELVVRTARRLHRSSMAELGPIGLTGAQARVVRLLEATDHAVRMADIAAALEVVPRTATSMVDGLEASGLVARATDPHDRRSVLVSLTEEGSQLLERLAQARRRSAEATFSPLASTERAELVRLLSALCGDYCEGPNSHCRPHGRVQRPDRHDKGSVK
jgi:DNA-binding MarR family transcriptional regulator